MFYIIIGFCQAYDESGDQPETARPENGWRSAVKPDYLGVQPTASGPSEVAAMQYPGLKPDRVGFRDIADAWLCRLGSWIAE